MTKFEERNKILEKEMNLLETNDVLQSDEILRANERIRILELENSKEVEVPFKVMMVDADEQMDYAWKEELNLLKLENEKLVNQINEFEGFLEELKKEKEMHCEEMQIFKDTIGMISAQKSYLVTLLRKMDGEIELGGFKESYTR